MESDGPYTEEIARIDEEICRLLAAREGATAGLRIQPDDERVARWSDQYGVAETRLRSLFANLAAGPRLNVLPPQPQDLRRVVEIMRRQTCQGLQFVLTHCLQYENASVLHMEIDSITARGTPRGMLDLDLDRPGHSVGGFGGHGTARHHAFDFIVWPALPDDLSSVGFTLRQGEGEQPVAEPVRLEEPIVFEP